MAGLRVIGQRGGIQEELLAPGDVILTADSFLAGSVSSTVNATITAQQMLSGVIYRTGPVGATYDSFDTPANVLAALAGNNPNANVVSGIAFRLRFMNTIAYVDNLSYATGVVTGLGNTSTVAATSWRDLLFTVLCPQTTYIVNSNITSSSNVVTFVLATGLYALQIGPAPTSTNIQIGATVSAASGIASGTTVTGVTMGQGGIIGVTLSANATATLSNTPLTFGPTMRVDSLGAGTL